MCEFRLLGPVEVVYDGRTLPIGAPKQRCVLARLLLEPGSPVPIEQLYAAVWGDDLPDAARKAVQVYISNLRRALADVPGLCGDGDRNELIRTTPGGYLIDVHPGRVDLHVFRDRAERAGSSEQLRQALDLWRGEPLGGLGDCALPRTEGARLTEERLAVVERLASAEIAADRASAAIPPLYDLVAAHPLRETGYALLMRALHRAGRLGEALAVYRDLRAMLIEELGTEPSPDLTRVHQDLLRVDSGSPNSAATAPGSAPAPAQLPPRLTELAGRADELHELRELLANPPSDRVLIAAISGYGGIGKSTLALSAAHAVAERFADGQLFADLGGSRRTPADPSDVVAGFLRAYGVSGDRIPDRPADRTALFRSITASHRVLVVLDDALDAAQVHPLLPGSAGSAVLLTSRARPTGLDGVRTLPLGELTDTEALAMLRQQVGPDRVRSEPDAADRIVRHCGGVPLAVRIAAGRLSRPAWTLTALADRLASAEPLDELYDGDLEVRASFDLSYRRLDDQAARVFRTLATTGAAGIGTFTTSTAAAILRLPERRLPRILNTLVDLHLLEEPEPERYRYHELLREFAVERSTNTDPPSERVAWVRHAFEHYATVAMDALNAMMPGLGLPVWPGERPGFAGAEDAVGWLAAEHVTVTDLGIRLLDQLPDADLQNAGAQAPGAQDPGAQEPGEQDPDPMLERIAAITLSLGNYAEIGGAWPGREELALRLLRHSEVRGPRSVADRARTVLAGLALRRADHEAAADWLDPVLADARHRGDLVTYGRLLAMLGVAYREADQFDRAADRLHAALDAHRQARYVRGYVSTLIHLADLGNLRGDHAGAARSARTAQRIQQAMPTPDPYLAMSAAHALGDARAAAGRRDEARTWYRHALELATTHGSTTLHREVSPKLARLSETP